MGSCLGGGDALVICRVQEAALVRVARAQCQSGCHELLRTVSSLSVPRRPGQ